VKNSRNEAFNEPDPSELRSELQNSFLKKSFFVSVFHTKKTNNGRQVIAADYVCGVKLHSAIRLVTADSSSTVSKLQIVCHWFPNCAPVVAMHCSCTNSCNP
jgi:hypothetical protein